jgi:hypothetical protein
MQWKLINRWHTPLSSGSIKKDQKSSLRIEEEKYYFAVPYSYFRRVILLFILPVEKWRKVPGRIAWLHLQPSYGEE